MGFLWDPQGPQKDELEAYIDALGKLLSPTDVDAIRTALSQVVARLIETKVLTDADLFHLARMPEVYLGVAEQHIRERMKVVGLDMLVDDSDIAHLRQLFTSGPPRPRPFEQATEGLVAALFQATRRLGEEMRCASCGYHFRTDDVAQRRRLAEQYEFVFADRLLPGRQNDHYKDPTQTSLEIDHIIPRAGWGPTRVDNLQLLCKFCNQGKMIFRWSLEALSSIVAASVAPIDGQSPRWAVRQAIVAAFAFGEHSCGSCGRSSRRVELTARPESRWLVPWHIAVCCYDCV